MSHSLHPPSRYSLAIPYPKIKVEGKNLLYAALLQDDYAGRISEFGAISQYLYHHFWFERKKPQLAKLLQGISLVEMHHMEMLAETIILLGGDPKIGGTYSTGCTYWNGSFVNYGYNILDRIKADIKSEIDAIDQYQYHSSIINDPNIKELIQRIILDEKEHIKLFRAALKFFEKSS